MENFKVDLWSNLLLQATRERIAYQNVVNNVGRIAGKKMTFPGVGPIDVKAYTQNTAMDLQIPTDYAVEINLDNQHYWNVLCDDIIQSQSQAAILTEIGRRAGNGLKKVVEQYIAGFYTGAGITSGFGSTTTPLELDGVQADSVLLEAAEAMLAADADMGSLWAVVPAWFWKKLTINTVQTSSNNVSVLENGFVGSRYGFDIYVSNNVANDSGSDYKIMCGDGDAIRFGMNIDKVESLRSEQTFGDILRGLLVFGGVVSRPETLLCISANEAAET